ncbi:hypothetical protein AK812_SmicGene2614 [Symbiodinium microadriaticum]|uniref:Uncharacterized protein n=1 Tax=Symbiodinium microadriaticum TaxID=2951 RepID=A0A1Q9F0Z5_SYMMI|nr:hypothetical protein AK812_SmicGene2614 [Symbiodinium microadriaticum]
MSLDKWLTGLLTASRPKRVASSLRPVRDELSFSHNSLNKALGPLGIFREPILSAGWSELQCIDLWEMEPEEQQILPGIKIWKQDDDPAFCIVKDKCQAGPQVMHWRYLSSHSPVSADHQGLISEEYLSDAC